MPLQNRVTPEGEIIATPHRGLMFGNRGAFHLPDKSLSSRRWASKRWIVCLLEFKGRRRGEMMMPRRYTELFFLDEATALAAGHRPCFECRREAGKRFAALFPAQPGCRQPLRADEIDIILHAERLGPGGKKATFSAQAGALPDGAFVRAAVGGSLLPCLIARQHLLVWSPAGYVAAAALGGQRTLEVLTPRSIIAVLCAGYRAMLHPSVSALIGE